MKMKKLITLFVCLLFAMPVLMVAGCAKKEEPAKPAAEAVKPAEPPKPAAPEKKAEEAKITTERGKVFYLRCTGKLQWSDEKIIGGKTRYTRKAGHCFICAARGATRTILVAILGSPSRKSLWTETKKLVSTNVQGNPPIKFSPWIFPYDNLFTKTLPFISF